MKKLTEYINENLLDTIKIVAKKFYYEILWGDIPVEKGIKQFKEFISNKNPNYTFELKSVKDIINDKKHLYNIKNNNISDKLKKQSLDWLEHCIKIDNNLKLACVVNKNTGIYIASIFFSLWSNENNEYVGDKLNGSKYQKQEIEKIINNDINTLENYHNNIKN